MTYDRFLKILNARGMFRIHPRLDRVRKVLRALGDPQDQIPALHIAGTNGKGSVAASLESVLRAGGYRTGLYTSPHLIDLRERVKINGETLTGGFIRSAEEVLAAEKKAKTNLTYFELMTAIAFRAFHAKKVDIAVIECGLGGLWDATNVIKNPLLSILTSVGLDHTEWLGKDEYQIAGQKAGIIKARGYVISGVAEPGRSVIAGVAREKRAELVQLDAHFTADSLTSSWRSGKQSIRFTFEREKSQIIPFGLLGSAQVRNAALVMAALRRLKQIGWDIPPAKRDQGLRDVRWPGRLQLFRFPTSAAILLDGAHNPQAMKSLLESIEDSSFKNIPKKFVFSSFKDKDYKTMGRMIARFAAEVWLCPLAPERGASLRQLRSAFTEVRGPVRSFGTPKAALENALADTSRDGLVVVCGSLSLVGEILKAIPNAALLKEKAHA